MIELEHGHHAMTSLIRSLALVPTCHQARRRERDCDAPEIEAQWSSEFLQAIRPFGATHDVDLSLPKFDFESTVDLAALLQEMGMSASFGSDADFTGITTVADFFIDAATHKATIAIVDNRTGAALFMGRVLTPPG